MTNDNKKTSSKGRSKSQVKRSAIIAAAAELFMEQGFDSTTMDDIANSADVSKQTVYSHFQSKEALFGAAIEDKVQEFDLTEEFFARNISCEAMMLDLAVHLNDLLTSDEPIKMFRLCAATAPTHPTLSKLFYENGPQKINKLVTNYLESQNRLGSLNIEDVDAAARQFTFMIKADAHQMLLFNMRPPTKKKTAAYLKSCVEVFMRAYSA
ncbi:MAG: TetR/AcrR family transcriptional repressor of mexJK operon [Pseudomonadales bacterium]|jgi:TetR/AcrR family transcriptional repressor of mexJK operon